MYKVITSRHEIGSLVKALQNVSVVPLDIETTGLDCFSDRVILIQLYVDSVAYILDCRKLAPDVITYIFDLIINSHKKVILHNADFDLKFLLYGYCIKFYDVGDTMLNEIMINNGLSSRKDRLVSLKSLAKKYLNLDMSKEVREDFIGNYDIVLTNEVLNYAALDVACLEKIYEEQCKILAEQKQLRVLALEEQVIPVVVAMEVEGIKVDVNMWRALVEQSIANAETERVQIVEQVIKDLLVNIPGKSAYEYTQMLSIPVTTKRDTNALSIIYDAENITHILQEKLNIGSSQQVAAVLRVVYGLEIESTNEKIINKLSKLNPIIDRIITFRENKKSATSFGDNYLNKIHPVTGKIHSKFNQLGADSGRFSSSSPNMQNIKAESSYRYCFIPDSSDWKFICADFSQQELRILAAIADETRMQDAFKNGVDLHASTAALLYGVPVEEVTKTQRSHAKALNFALSYGSSEYGLEKNFDIDLELGRELINNYYNNVYTKVRDFKEAMRPFILEKHYSTTMLGRKRFFERKTLFTDYKEIRRHENSIVREGINHVIQGTSADVTKLAMVSIYRNNPFGDNLKLLIQVHDEVVVMVHVSVAIEAKEFVRRCMLDAEQQFLGDKIPAAVDVKDPTDRWEH